MRGKSALLISHVLPEVERLCARVAVLNEGCLIHLGPLGNLTRDPATGAARPLEDALRELYEGPVP